jgi:outer membrane protein TolC
MNRDCPLASKAGLSGLVLGILLGGCSVGPKYKAPTPALTGFHNSVAASAAANASPPPLDRWWTGFNDPMLETVVQRALNSNLDLAAALARVDQARAAAAGAGARLLPTADFGANATAERQSLAGNLGTIAGGFPTFRRDIHEYALGPAASWEIDLAGGLRHGGAAARHELQAAQAIQAGTRVTVAADAADAYLQIRGYQTRLAVAKNQIATDEHLVQLVRNRYDAGAASKREIAQADAVLEQARGIVPVLRLSLEKQLNRLMCLWESSQACMHVNSKQQARFRRSQQFLATSSRWTCFVADRISSQQSDGSLRRTNVLVSPFPSITPRFPCPERWGSIA